MKRIWQNTILIFSSCLLGFIIPVKSQAVHFTAQVQDNQVGLNEPFQVQYVLENGSNISAFNPPAFRGFTVLQNYQSQQTSIVNGQMSSSVSITYVLQATSPGKFTIPPATATVNGNTVSSNAVNITVSKDLAGNNNNTNNNNSQQSMAVPVPSSPPAFGQPAPDDDDMNGLPGVLKKGESPLSLIKKNLFVKVDVDKTNVYQGEQILATYKLYTRLQTSASITKVPAFSGFSTEDIDLPNPPQANIEYVDGKEFKVFTIRKTILFPLQTGTLQLDPVEIDNSVRLYKVNRSKKSSDNDPFDNFFKDQFGKDPFDDPFFSDPFGNSNVTYQNYEYNLKSTPVDIHVKPLPTEGQPAGFNGAVGDFTINASIDKTSLSTDDAGTLTVTISGSGNLNLLNAPTVNFPSEFDSYDPKTTDHFNKNSIPFSGNRSFEYVFMPHTPGNYTIPSVEFSYFDPSSESYKTIRTDSFSIHVTPGKNQGFNNPVDYANLGSQLVPIRTMEIAWNKNNFLFITNWWYWCLLLLPVLILIILVAWKNHQTKLQSDQVLFKNKRANKVAVKRLSAAAKFLQQHNEKAFYEETSHAIWGYLSHKLNIPFASLSKEKVLQMLGEKQIPGNDIISLFNLLDECERALYAPPGGQVQMQMTYREGMQVISKLEEKLK
jgi:BatD DUF11 like domain